MYDEDNNETNFIIVGENENESKNENENMNEESYDGSMMETLYEQAKIQEPAVRTDWRAVEQIEDISPQVEFEAAVNYVDVVEENTKKEKKKKSTVRRFFERAVAITVSAALFGVVAGSCFQLVNKSSDPDNSVQTSVVDGTITGNNGQEILPEKLVPVSGIETVDSTDVSTVVENVLPAIVAINCTADQTYDYFGRRYSQEVSGSGSGIIIGQTASEILIVTNNHVISGAKTVEIVFADDSTASATIKGTESSSDLAVVTVKVSDLSKDTIKSIKVATLGNSDIVKMGQMAIAIGNALGYGQSTTVGYISALNRKVTVDGVTLTLLQTDAAINPGNSGGALLNTKGEVIGINAVKYADTDVEGIGYAIPISQVIPIINDLMNRETIASEESGYLGIVLGDDITEDLSKSLNMPIGVYVYSVSKGSAAEKAGLKDFDIITGFKGKTIKTQEELLNVLSYTKAGTEVELTVMSLENGAYVEKKLTVVLGNKPK